MNMKGHILAALREQFNHWEELLSSLNDEQISVPRFDYNWSIKHVVTHLWGWQQISISRMNAGVLNQQPELPQWVEKLAGDWEENAAQTNTWIYAVYHDRPWPEVYRSWREGFMRFLELGELLPEKDLLDGDKFPWLKGYSLAFILVSSYDHHQEHLEKLLAALQK